MAIDYMTQCLVHCLGSGLGWLQGGAPYFAKLVSKSASCWIINLCQIRYVYKPM